MVLKYFPVERQKRRLDSINESKQFLINKAFEPSMKPVIPLLLYRSYLLQKLIRWETLGQKLVVHYFTRNEFCHTGWCCGLIVDQRALSGLQFLTCFLFQENGPAMMVIFVFLAAFRA